MKPSPGAGTTIEHAPGDLIGPDSVATIRSEGMAVTFEMAEYAPPDHWM